jgi:hypothetical protein
MTLCMLWLLGTESHLAVTVYDRTEGFIALMWPTGFLGLYETSMGATPAAALAIGANVLLMLVIGLIVTSLPRSTIWSVVAIGVLGALLTLTEFLWAGGAFEFMNLGALVAAVLMVSLVVWISRSVKGESSP